MSDRTARNQVSGMLVALQTQIADPVARLRAVATANAYAKEQVSAINPMLLQDFGEVIGSVLLLVASIYSVFFPEVYGLWTGILRPKLDRKDRELRPTRRPQQAEQRGERKPWALAPVTRYAKNAGRQIHGTRIRRRLEEKIPKHQRPIMPNRQKQNPQRNNRP